MDSSSLGQDLKDFLFCLIRYTGSKTLQIFRLFEHLKSRLAARLYWQRGRYTRPFIHSGMALLIIGGITLGPVLIAENFPGFGENPWQEAVPPSAVLSAATGAEMETATLISVKPRAEIIEYEVQPGDTVSGIAEKFGRYSIDAQGIVDWPYNSFANDETFALAVGQNFASDRDYP